MEISTEKAELDKASRDTSLFRVEPSEIAWPKNAEELAELVKNAKGPITARAAGTDMSGGPLNTGTIVEFTKYMNHVLEVGSDYALTEPGVYYRDFEKETLKKGLILPSYPASRELCAMGGIVANNSGGERTLEYGKTEKYVEELEVVLADGTVTTFKALSPSELQMKKVKVGLEGDIYRKMHALLTENAALIAAHKPRVSKNSAGYYLWDVIDERGNFNLAKLICGSQGTLALWTKAKLGLVKPKAHRAMLVGFLHDLAPLPEVVARVLPFAPESFESYDDKTFELAVRFLPQMLAQMGWIKAARLGIDFLPEAVIVLEGGVPKLILMAEFAEDTIEEADAKAQSAKAALAGLPIELKIEKNEKESEKYWIVRRESFSLLRKNLHGLYAAPFIDDFVVPPASYPQFLPALDALLAPYKGKMIYTIAGHIGNGNFHIIPLMDLASPKTKQTILELAPKVYELVIKYGGTTTGEHNDGIIRTPYLPMLFGPQMMKLFEETKKTFDPRGIFNPGKKVGGTFADIAAKMLAKN
jgi:FAD/FMN-containing dehydrogenase